MSFFEVSIHTAGRVYRFVRYMHTANVLVYFVTYLLRCRLTTSGIKGGVEFIEIMEEEFLNKTWNNWSSFQNDFAMDRVKLWGWYCCLVRTVFRSKQWRNFFCEANPAVAYHAHRQLSQTLTGHFGPKTVRIKTLQTFVSVQTYHYDASVWHVL